MNNCSFGLCLFPFLQSCIQFEGKKGPTRTTKIRGSSRGEGREEKEFVHLKNMTNSLQGFSHLKQHPSNLPSGLLSSFPMRLPAAGMG
jgi:hypothetical protein